jgi:putative membrane protein
MVMWGNGFISQGWGGPFGVPVAVGIVFLVIWAVRVLSHTARRDNSASDSGILPTPGTTSGARQVFDGRYVKGELTTEEYRQRLSVLGESTK